MRWVGVRRRVDAVDAVGAVDAVDAVGAVGVGVGVDVSVCAERRVALRSSCPLREHEQRSGAPAAATAPAETRDAKLGPAIYGHSQIG